MFKVRKRRCDACLFSDARIVSAERKEDVLAQCAQNDSHFICHKHDDVCCRGFYDLDPGGTNLMRIAGRLGAVVFIETEDEPAEAES